MLKEQQASGSASRSRAPDEEEYEIDPEEGVPVPKRLLYSEEKFKAKILTGTPCMPGNNTLVKKIKCDLYRVDEGSYRYIGI